MPKELLPPETLHKLLRYDPETGNLFWRQRTADMFRDGARPQDCICAAWNARHADNLAFTAIDKCGYLVGHIFGKYYRAHRVIWAMQNGSWPVESIDHIDGKKANNRIQNLREATASQNSMNRKSQARSSSQYLGVSFYMQTRKWRAQIYDGTNRLHLGYFSSEIDAARAYDSAALEIYGAFANPNFPE